MGGQGRRLIITYNSPKRYRRCQEPDFPTEERLCLRTTSQSRFARQGRVAAPSVCFAAARILLAAAPTAPPCFRHWRRSSPLPLVGEPLAKPFTLRGLPRPPLGRGGGSASALTERLSPAAAHGQASLRTTSQSRRKLLDSSPSRGASGETVHSAGTAKDSPR